jgi:DNA-directed RNA polymerase specialized sigma24 family protein
LASDEEDVLISVFDRFFQAARKEGFARLNNRDDLWRILLMLTEQKVAERFRRAGAQKRGAGRVVALNPTPSDEPVDVDQLHALVDREPPAEFVAAFNEWLHVSLQRLDAGTTRQVALCRLEGYSDREIATQLGISVSSVERKLRVIRELWQREDQ